MGYGLNVRGRKVSKESFEQKKGKVQVHCLEKSYDRPRINVKKLYCEKKRAKQAKKPTTNDVFFIFALQFLTFRDVFRLVQRAFRGESM